MICRDTQKDSTYFEEYILEQKNRISQFVEVKKQLDSKEKIEKCNSIISSLERDLFCAQFSAGYSREELIDTFHEYVCLFVNTEDISYEEYINALAINILLDAGNDDLLKSIRPSFDVDALLELLLYGDTDKKELNFPDYYQVFLDYMNENVSTDYFIDYIANKWYSSSYNLYWYESLDNENNTYVGYWCWLAAAILKNKRITLKEKPNYIPSI